MSKWELENSTPDLEKLILLCDYFEISLDELVLGNKLEAPKEEQNASITITSIHGMHLFFCGTDVIEFTSI